MLRANTVVPNHSQQCNIVLKKQKKNTNCEITLEIDQCTIRQSDQGLHCLLTGSADTIFSVAKRTIMPVQHRSQMDCSDLKHADLYLYYFNLLFRFALLLLQLIIMILFA